MILSPHATRSVQPQAWNDFSTANKNLAERELLKSQKLREFIFHTIEETTNALRLQTENTNFDFRKRMYEMKRAKEELEYQMKTVREWKPILAGALLIALWFWLLL